MPSRRLISSTVSSSQSATIPAALLHFIDSGGSPVQFTLDEIERAQTLLALRPFQPLQKFSDNLRDEQLKIAASCGWRLFLRCCCSDGVCMLAVPCFMICFLCNCINVTICAGLRQCRCLEFICGCSACPTMICMYYSLQQRHCSRCEI